MTGRVVAFVTLSMLAAPAVFAADVLEFRKVDVFIVQDNGDAKKRDARLEIDTAASEIRLVDEKRGASRATYAVIPFDRIIALIYEVEWGKTWGGVVTVPPARHWLTIRSEELPSGQMRVRLDGDNQRELRFALRVAIGIADTTISRPAR